MDHWNEQLSWIAASKIDPGWVSAVKLIKSRVLYLRKIGYACDGIEDAIKVRRWIDLRRMTQGEKGLQLQELSRAGNRAEILQNSLSHAILSGLAAFEAPLAHELWVRIVVDAMFGFGDVTKEALATDNPGRHSTAGVGLTQFGECNLHRWCSLAAHVELVSPWNVNSPEELGQFFVRLAERYGPFDDNSLSWPDSERHQYFAGILDLVVAELAQDAAPFTDLLAHQASGIDLQGLKDTPSYQQIESFWNRFLGRSWLNDGAWLVGKVTQLMLDDPDAVCNPWKVDKAATKLTRTLAAKRRAARLGQPEPKPVLLPGLPPDWPPEGAGGLLFGGTAGVSHGWLMVQHEEEPQASFEGFNGQQNGLIGALRPGTLTLNTGLAHGDVHLALWQCEQEPPMPPAAWEEVVEVSLVVPDGVAMRLENLEADFQESLVLAAGAYRVRVVAARYGRRFEGGDRDEDGKPMERYALAFWPDTAWRPDVVLRQQDPGLIRRHQQAQASKL